MGIDKMFEVRYDLTASELRETTATLLDMGTLLTASHPAFCRMALSFIMD